MRHGDQADGGVSRARPQLAMKLSKFSDQPPQLLSRSQTSDCLIAASTSTQSISWVANPSATAVNACFTGYVDSRRSRGFNAARLRALPRGPDQYSADKRNVAQAPGRPGAL